jgi:large subunit ribosomal protein L6
MSRIGKAPITIPSGVTVTVEGTNVKVKGPKGELTQEIDPAITVVQEDGVLTFTRPSDEKEHRSKHGLYRALVANMVTGVTEGYRVDMELVGVGYRASAAGQELTLALGYSHPIVMVLPNEIKLESETKKGSNPTITLTSHDRQLIGMVAAKIRSFRKPEPYKGKGIRFVGEVIRRKAGKTASK